MFETLKLSVTVFAFFVTTTIGYSSDLFHHTKAEWIQEAFTSLAKGRYPNVKAVAWWNEDFDDTKLSIDSSKESLKAYQQGISLPKFTSKAHIISKKIYPASNNSIYHAANPGFGATEDNVSAKSILEFEALAHKKIVWAYFSNNWYGAIKFPFSEVSTIHKSGKIPFIRLMPRSDYREKGPDLLYTLQKIIDGEFDKALVIWALDAKKSNIPLLVEFGTEVNGDWFPWSGKYNGGGVTDLYGNPNEPDGPERFRDAYRHIIYLFRKHNVDNITWFFHVDALGEPQSSWNTIEKYYPGDNYIDWIGVSVYGAQKKDESYHSFIEIMDKIYPAITKLSGKPIAILELGITELNKREKAK